MLTGPIDSKADAMYMSVVVTNDIVAKVADIEGLPSVARIQSHEGCGLVF